MRIFESSQKNLSVHGHNLRLKPVLEQGLAASLCSTAIPIIGNLALKTKINFYHTVLLGLKSNKDSIVYFAYYQWIALSCWRTRLSTYTEVWQVCDMSTGSLLWWVGRHSSPTENRGAPRYSVHFFKKCGLARMTCLLGKSQGIEQSSEVYFRKFGLYKQKNSASFRHFEKKPFSFSRKSEISPN